VGLASETKLFCLFLAQRAARDPLAGLRYTSPNRRLLAEIVKQHQLADRVEDPAKTAKGRKPKVAAPSAKTQRGLGQEVRQSPSDEAAALGVSVESLRLYRSGATVLSPPRMARVLQHLANAVVARHETLVAAAGRNLVTKEDLARSADVVKRLTEFIKCVELQVSSYEVTDLLGFDNETEVQWTLDAYIHRRRPVLQHVWMPNADGTPEAVDTREHLKDLLGLYVLYLWRDGGRQAEGSRKREPSQLLRCPLRVRYLLTLEHEQALIRIKISVPNMRNLLSGKPHALDGIVVNRESHLAWLTESRAAPSQDFLQFLTYPFVEAAASSTFTNEKSCRAATGRYLTVGQRGGEIVSDRLLLVLHDRARQYPLATRRDEGFMSTAGVVELESDEYAEAERLYKKASYR
jgi:hypothetical protein